MRSANETAAHNSALLPFSETRSSLRDRHTGLIDLKSLVGTAKGVRRLAKWFIRLRVLPQFHLTDELLYGGDQPGEQPGEETS